jgi:hypothetical protein
MVTEQIKLDSFLLGLYNHSKINHQSDWFSARDIASRYNLPIQLSEIRRIVNQLENSRLIKAHFVGEDAKIRMESEGFLFCEKESYNDPTRSTINQYVFVIDDSSIEFKSLNRNESTLLAQLIDIIQQDRIDRNEIYLSFAEEIDDLINGKITKGKIEKLIENVRTFFDGISILEFIKNIYDKH